MRCPKCKNRVLQKSGDRIRLRTQGPLVFDQNGVCRARCYWCGETVEIPLELKKGVVVQGERFVLAGRG